MKCPICKEEIEEDAKKCKHCGSYTRKGRRKWEVIKDVVQFVTFISAIIVLYLMYQSNQRMQEQLNLQKQSVEEFRQEFIEEKRPRLEIRPTKIDLNDTTMLLYVDIDNTGFADAEDVFLYLVLKYADEPKDTLATDLARVSKITKATALTQTWSLTLLHRADLTCLIEVRYTWTIQNLNYKDKKYFQFIYEKEIEKYRIRVFTKEQIEGLWE